MKYQKVKVTKSNSDVLNIDENRIKVPTKDGSMIIRSAGELAGKGYFLETGFDWIVVEDDTNQLVLLKLYKGALDCYYGGITLNG